MSEDARITDPASEIASLFVEFSEIKPPSRGDNTQSALSAYFEFDPSSAEWYELIGAIASRIRRLRDFISSTNDRFVKQRMRAESIKSLDHMAQVLGPEHMNSDWHKTKINLFTSAHIGNIEAFASIAEKYHPLKLLDEDQRLEMVEKIDETLNSFDEIEDVPQWAIEPVYDGLQTLKRILMHLRFFGHRAAIDAVLNISGKLEGIASSDLPKQQKKSILEIVRKGMHVVFFVGEVLLLPANAYQGYHIYREVALEHLVSSKDEKLKIVNKKAGQKALPAPKKGADTADESASDEDLDC